MTDADSFVLFVFVGLTWTVIIYIQLWNTLFRQGLPSFPLTFSGITPRSGMCPRWRTSLLAQGDPPLPPCTTSVGRCEVEISNFLIFDVVSYLFLNAWLYVLCRHEPRVSRLLHDWSLYRWPSAVPSHRISGSGLEDSDEITRHSHGTHACYI